MNYICNNCGAEFDESALWVEVMCDINDQPLNNANDGCPFCGDNYSATSNINK